MRSQVSENAHSLKTSTKLGSQRECAKQGRWAKVHGDHWRSEAREKLTFAANGLLMDIWSYCADQATDQVSTTVMRKLCAADAKNAGRMRQQLVSAGYLAATTDGWVVLKWQQLNPVAKHYPLRVVEPPADEALGGSSEEAETLSQRSAPPEIIEEPCVPRARAETQDPEEREEKERTTPPPTAVPPRARAPRKVRPKDPRKETFRRVLSEACRDGGVLLEGALSPTQLAAASKRAGEHAEREGIDYETASRKLCSDAVTAVREGRKSALCWALRDWQPNAAPPRPLYGRQKLEIAPCSPASDFESEEESWRKVRERRAQIEREKLAREEARRVGT